MGNKKLELHKRIAVYKQTELDSYKYLVDLRKHCVSQVLEKLYNGGDADIVVTMAKKIEDYILNDNYDGETDINY